MPPLMPAAKLRPVGPSTTTRPPVMYSQPWSPTPSTTARDARVADARSARRRDPRKNARPARRAVEDRVADDRRCPRRRRPRPSGGRTASTPPDIPLPTKSFASPLSVKVTPGASQAPKLWPPEPSSSTAIVSSARPSAPKRRATSPEISPPTVRSLFRTRSESSTALAPFEGGLRALDQLPVAVVVEHRVLRRAPCAGGPRRARPAARAGCVRSTPRAFQCSIAGCGLEQVGAADELLEAAHAELRHVAADFLGDEEEEVDDVLGLAAEARAQLRVLRRDPHRARVEVAGAHHDAADRDQRRGREAELLRAEQRGDDDVATRLQLPVGLHDDPVTQLVHDERLLRLGEPDLPRDARRLDRRDRRGAGAAVVARDHDVVGVRLGDARRDGADADLGDELDADARARVRAAKVEDQLLEVLDRVDVVVRRRRDQPDARRRVADRGDVGVDLVAGELAALAGLRALRHLDLELVGVDEVVGGDAEAAGGDLLDRRAPPVAVRVRA